MKVFKASMKPLRHHKEVWKKNFKLIFSLCPGSGREGLIRCLLVFSWLYLTLSWWRSLSCRNQSIDLRSKPSWKTLLKKVRLTESLTDKDGVCYFLQSSTRDTCAHNHLHRMENLQFPADFFTFTEEILNGKLHFLCSDFSILPFYFKHASVGK